MVHLYWNGSESDVASDLLQCLKPMYLYLSDSRSDKDQRKKIVFVPI